MKTIILWIPTHLSLWPFVRVQCACAISISVIWLCYCHCHCGDWNFICCQIATTSCMPMTNISRHLYALILSQNAVMQNGCMQSCDAFRSVILCVCVYEIHLSTHFMLVSVNFQCIFQTAINCLQQPFGWPSSLCSLPAYRMDTQHIHQLILCECDCACVRTFVRSYEYFHCAISINKTKLKHP